MTNRCSPKYCQVEGAPRRGRLEAPLTPSAVGLAAAQAGGGVDDAPGKSVEETARFMATGVGIFGSSLAYIESLAEHFETIGI